MTELTTTAQEAETISRKFNWLSAAITFLNFCFTTILLVMAHLVIYRQNIRGATLYLLIALPYLLFIIFSVVNYGYIYELYNLFQEKAGMPIDTPDMPVFAFNTAVFAFTIGAINLAIVWGLKKVGD